MNTKNVYLKTNVVPEPLFDSWYASSYLIPPASAAMFTLERHLKIMNSYIQAPHVHEAAVKDPKMLGGPFMDYPTRRVEDIKRLKERTLAEQKDLLELAKAIQDFNTILLEEADGHGIEEIYRLVPDILKGYVEIYYDLNNQPGFRFFESLLYRSKYYKESSQSIAFYLINSDDRPFVLSTPRLELDNMLHKKIPFRHPGIDELFKMQRKAAPYQRVRDMLEIQPDEEPIFKTFFTEQPPPLYPAYGGDGVRMRYFGHACILLETKNVSILSDPVISYGYDNRTSRYTYTDLPDFIDYVIITHNHQDHILLETILQLRHKIGTVIIPGCGPGTLQDQNLKFCLRQIGVNNIVEIEEMEKLDFGTCTISGLPFIGEHCDLQIRTKMCYHVCLNDFSAIFLADSNNIEPRVYDYVYKDTGDIDVMFLGMECDGAPLTWLYGPLLPEAPSREMDNSRRLAGSNYMKGIHLVDRFNPKEVYVYAMGQEPWLTYIMSLKYTEESNPIIQSNKLLEECRSRGLTAERLYGEKELVYDAAF
ncbi:MAG TPA: MBL fold metallo-hydrolase [Puia sp.]|nr:MBL fold metallo-hydrolase [Puia sp.]